MECNSLEQFKLGARQTTDSETTLQIEKWVGLAIGEIARAARSDSAAE